MSLALALKEEALRLGFERVGITTPEPPEHFSVYQAWVDAGRQGEMGYLATERARSRRADPRTILPECRSILVLAMHYPSPAGFPPGADASAVSESLPGRTDNPSHPPFPLPTTGGWERGIRVDTPQVETRREGPAAGKIAAYACGPDYHETLPPRLQALVAFLEAQVGGAIPNRWYTDTGPVLERDLAQRAGLGWIGKNTCLISPGLGSYFLLAEILLGIDLEPDAPFLPDRCGSCTRCLTACPTGCILPDRTIDARRCISYLTIELKGVIPADLRPRLGSWVFGCDICQQVCPWNRFAPSPVGGCTVDLEAELGLTPQAFNRRFRHTPVLRTRRRGYLRNVAVALGNTRDPDFVRPLAQALQGDPEPLVRGHAAWALGQIGGETALRALRACLSTEIDPAVQAEIRTALEAYT